MTIDVPEAEPRGIPIAPAELTATVLARLPGALLAFDVDGVLAPLVDHVDQSALSAGVAEALAVLARATPVTLLSGRSLESLSRLLVFPEGLMVIGSHGLEVYGTAGLELTSDERARYDRLVELGEECALTIGGGAWLERKPASVAVHTRLSPHRDRVQEAIGQLVATAVHMDGVTVKAGHDVVELMVRATDKGTALIDLAHRVHASSVVFLGDDRTDEDAFALMSPDDVSVRVGPGDTVAHYRLAGTAEVAAFVTGLADAVASA